MGDDISKNKKSGLHIGLIPDGNRRYATNKKIPIWKGHWEGANKISNFIDWCGKDGRIKIVSIFALSTENLNRTKQEVNELWKVYETQFNNLIRDKEKNRVKVRILGNDAVWKPGIKDVVKNVIDSTKHYSKGIVNIMLAYGSKFEITDAIQKAAKKPLGVVDKFLLVKEPLDLIIRTGKQRRLSNFMLYQASYAEIFFSDTLWPEFTKKEFDDIIDWYFEQQKKFGH